MDFNEYNATEAVLESFSNINDDRLKTIMNSIITHLHQVVKEVEPSEEEWMQAITFLTSKVKNVTIDVKNLYFFQTF